MKGRGKGKKKSEPEEERDKGERENDGAREKEGEEEGPGKLKKMMNGLGFLTHLRTLTQTMSPVITCLGSYQKI